MGLLLGAVLGLAAGFFLDPTSGRRRRAMLRDRLMATGRRGGAQAAQAARSVGAEAYGAAQAVQHRQEEPKEFDDVTLARKVETEIFRDADAPKGRVDVNAHDGVVQLRGEVDSQEMIDELVNRTRDVQGVQEVENLLHLPGEAAPMQQ